MKNGPAIVCGAAYFTVRKDLEASGGIDEAVVGFAPDAAGTTVADGFAFGQNPAGRITPDVPVHERPLFLSRR
ncbi:MAG: hypothetical protein JWN64_637 [Parcubacteria group bacterium]|nr:hypothetical protein [Parcubacteria group bacterium]